MAQKPYLREDHFSGGRPGLSLPYHIGNGWFGGLLPATAFAISAQTGNIYAGLWYAIVIAVMTVIIGTLFVPSNSHKRDIFDDRA